METKYPILKYFKFDHLPERLQSVSKPFCKLAETMSLYGDKNPQETAAGLRKLLEAKDCAVRSVLD